MQEKSTEEYAVYPNPIQKGENLIINSSNLSQIEVYNVLGKRELSIKIELNNTKISTSSMEKGMYFDRLYSREEGIFNQKIIIE